MDDVASLEIAENRGMIERFLCSNKPPEMQLQDEKEATSHKVRGGVFDL